MTRPLFTSLVIAFFLSLALSFTTGAQTAPESSVRIGIYNPDSPELGALLTTALGKRKDIELVEREALERIGDEAKTQQLASDDPVALGKLLNADGLLFVEKGKEGLQVRLTSVSLGYVLFDDPFESSVSLEEATRIIEHKVAAYRSKIKLTPEQAIPVSVLNFRGEISSRGMKDLERKLTLLFESRLASLPRFVVLERRHAWSVGFERSLDAAPGTLLHGVYRIDGLMSISSETPDNLLLKLRIRQPNGKCDSADITGLKTDLPGLVEKILEEFNKRSVNAALTTAPEATAKEARDYLEEGIWARRNGQPKAALEALDSAELLGEKAVDLWAARIRVLCDLGGDVPDLFNGSDWMNLHRIPSMKNPELVMPKEPRSDERADQMFRAIDDMNRYKKADGPHHLEVFGYHNGRVSSIGGEGQADMLESYILNASSKVLLLLDQLQHPRTEEMRQALRDLVGYDPEHRQLGGVHALEYAVIWSHSPAEVLTFYHALCSKYPKLFIEPRSPIDKPSEFPSGNELDRILFRDGPDHFCYPLAKTPQERTTIFYDLVTRLIADPVTKPLGLAVQTRWAKPSEKASACQEFLAELWKGREVLLQNRSLGIFLKRAIDFQTSISKPACPELVSLIRYYLQNDTQGKPDKFVWEPSLFPPEDAPSLLNDLQANKKRYLASQPDFYRKMIEFNYSKMEEKYAKYFELPRLPATLDSERPLEVNRFWTPCKILTNEKLVIQTIRATRGNDDTLWIYGSEHQPQRKGRGINTTARAVLFNVSLPDLKTECTMLPWPVYPQRWNFHSILADSNGVYLASRNYSDKDILDRYQFSSKTWQHHEIFPGFDQLFLVDGKIYYSTRPESGLCRYDLQSKQSVILASSRRRPAQNQFDDEDHYLIWEVFLAPDGKVCAQFQTGNYIIQETPGDWPQCPDFDHSLRYSKDRYADSIYYSCGSTTHSNREESTFNLTSKGGVRFSTSIDRMKKGGETMGYGYRGDDIFMLNQKDILTLLWFKAGNPEPIPIPLRLKIDDETQALLKSVYPPAIFNEIKIPDFSRPEFFKMVVTDQGICLFAHFGGFWFLPFSDIDAYLKSVESPSAN